MIPEHRFNRITILLRFCSFQKKKREINKDAFQIQGRYMQYTDKSKVKLGTSAMNFSAV